MHVVSYYLCITWRTEVLLLLPKCYTLPFAFRGMDLSSGGMPHFPFTYGDLLLGELEIFLLACGGLKI